MDIIRRFWEYMMLNHPTTQRNCKGAFVAADPSVYLATNGKANQRGDRDAQFVEIGNSHTKLQKQGRP